MLGKTLYLGDIHSDFEAFEILVSFMLRRFSDVERVVQVGDFGFWPDFPISSWYQLCKLPVPVYFIDGNHEQFSELALDASRVPAQKSQVYSALHIPRGYCESGVLYMGGADSPDKEYRHAGIDWFPEENIRQRDMEIALENIARHQGQIHVMVCHETTEGAFRNIKRPHWKSGDQNRIFLDQLFARVRPRLFIHGHYHFPRRYEHQGCLFVGLQNVDHFHNELLAGDNLEEIARRCCVVADQQGRVYDIERSGV